MRKGDYVAFISNGSKLGLSSVDEIVELESHDQVIQAKECGCTNNEHLSSCEIENVVVELETQNKERKKYIVEMAFCKECGAYYIPLKSYEFLAERGTITHHVKGGARLFEYVKRGDAFNEEKTKLEQIKNTLREEYNNLPETISRYAIDDGCGGLRDIQGVKYSSKAIYKKQDEIADLTLQPYIGRIDISDGGEKACVYYIGKAEDKKIGNIHVYSRWSEQGRIFGKTADPSGVVDGKKRQVDLRRKIDIMKGDLRGIEDVFASNSEYADRGIYDKFLIQVLMTRKKSHQLTDIIATIQDKQNEIIEKAFAANIIVQGCAGSGKTMVMLHRLSFWLYNNKSLKPEKIKILTPNENFNTHIGGLHSQLKLGNIEILSVDQYYVSLLNLYDKDFSFHKKIDEEENIEERFLNYVYSKTFVKRMRALYPEIIKPFLLEEEYEFVRICAGKSGIKYKIIDDMTDGEKIIQLSKYIESIARKNAAASLEAKRIRERIDANKEEIEICRKIVEENQKESERRERDFKEDLIKIMDQILSDNKEEFISLSSALEENRANLEKLNRGFRRIIRGDLLRQEAEKEKALTEKLEENTKTRELWLKAREMTKNAERIADVAEALDTRKNIKNGNLAANYISEYKKIKRVIFKQNEKILKSDTEIAKDEELLSGKDSALTEDEMNRIESLIKKFPKNVALFVFNEVFNRAIAEKLEEFDIDRSNKTYRYELYARVLFAEMFWNKTVGVEEIICVDEGQDVSYCEYERIIEQNKKNHAFYNVYGDLNQRIKQGRGLVTWEQLKKKLIACEYELNENYRNTNQITRYCNEIFNYNMTLTGVEGDPVRNISFREMLDETLSIESGDERVAIILPRSIAKARITRNKIVESVKDNFSTKFDTSKISVMYVDEIKGIEFDRVYVIDETMGRNERYIAYTRALDKLAIVHQ